MNRIIVALIVSFVPFVTQAQAQDTTTSSALERAVVSGEDVALEVDGEREPIRGRLLSATADLVAIDTGGAIQSIDFRRVARVDRRGDSVINGAMIGAALLGGMCRWTCLEMKLRSQAYYVGNVVAATILGGVIGATIDSKHVGTTTIYRRGRRASVGVMLSPGSVGIAAQFGGR